MSESGIIQAIYDEALGSVISADITAGDSIVYVSSVAFFAPEGGTVTLSDGDTNEETWAYTSIDEDALALVGSTVIINSYDADDTRADVYPAVTSRTAEVMLDGQQDTVRARVPFAIFDKLGTGFLAENAGETLRVLVELRDEYVVTDVLGTVPEVALNTLTVADDLTINGQLTMTTGATGLIEEGVLITLESQLSNPSSALSASTSWYEEQLASITPGFDYYHPDSLFQQFNDNERSRPYWDTVDNKLIFVGGRDSAGLTGIMSVDMATGVATQLANILDFVSDISVVRLGSYYYMCHYDAAAVTWRVNKYSTSWVFDSQWSFTPYKGKPIIGEDGTDLWIATKGITTYRYRFERYNTAGVLQSTVNTDSTTEVPEAVNLRGFIPNRALDWDGGARFTCMFNFDDNVYSYNTSGVLQEDETFEGGSLCRGVAWDGTNIWTLAEGSAGTASEGGSPTYSQLRRFEHNQTTGSLKMWLAYTWYDSIGTTHETLPSPVASFTAKNRKQLNVSLPTIVPGEGGTDEPDTARIYLNHGSADPGTYYLQTVTLDGTDGSITDWVFSGTESPSSNDFGGAGDSAILESGDQGNGYDSLGGGVGWQLRGDGTASGFCDIQTFLIDTADKTWYKPQSGGLTMAEIHLVGGGGGGGGGRRSSSGAAGGGAGGSGGCYGIVRIPLTFLDDQETVVVGEGGAGGAGSASTSNGGTGTAGTDSSLTTNWGSVFAGGGAAGLGGTNAAGGASGDGYGASTAPVTSGGAGSPGAFGGNGGPGDSAPRLSLYDSAGFFIGGAGGGGAGGYDSSSTAYDGGNGGRSYNMTGGTGGVTSTDPTAGQDVEAGLPMPGAGGGGSGGRHGADCKDGARGGRYGGGGGGGGGCSGAASGDGGAGYDGIVMVVCY